MAHLIFLRQMGVSRPGILVVRASLQVTHYNLSIPRIREFSTVKYRHLDCNIKGNIVVCAMYILLTINSPCLCSVNYRRPVIIMYCMSTWKMTIHAFHQKRLNDIVPGTLVIVLSRDEEINIFRGAGGESNGVTLNEYVPIK